MCDEYEELTYYSASGVERETNSVTIDLTTLNRVTAMNNAACAQLFLLLAISPRKTIDELIAMTGWERNDFFSSMQELYDRDLLISEQLSDFPEQLSTPVDIEKFEERQGQVSIFDDQAEKDADTYRITPAEDFHYLLQQIERRYRQTSSQDMQSLMRMHHFMGFDAETLLVLIDAVNNKYGTLQYARIEAFAKKLASEGIKCDAARAKEWCNKNIM